MGSRRALDGGNWFLRTRYGRVDVLQYIENVLATDAELEGLSERSKIARIPGVGDAPIASYEDLVALKIAADRSRDRDDLEALRKLRK